MTLRVPAGLGSDTRGRERVVRVWVMDHLDDLPTLERGEVRDQLCVLSVFRRRAHDHHYLVACTDDVDEFAETAVFIGATHELQCLPTVPAGANSSGVAAVPLDVAIEEFPDGVEVPDRGRLKTKARQLNVRFRHLPESRTVRRPGHEKLPSQPNVARAACDLCQDLDVPQVDIDTSIGYALKRTATALRTAMEASLRSLGLSVPQYSCLEHLNARPGISNADLARGVFVTRQAMHQLLSGLQEAKLVSAVGRGRVQRYSLTAEGQRTITAASAAVAAVEEQMLSGLPPAERRRLHGDLERCTAALGEG
jgi:DNA-binding MarR family transcriptional regulator